MVLAVTVRRPLRILRIGATPISANKIDEEYRTNVTNKVYEIVAVGTDSITSVAVDYAAKCNVSPLVVPCVVW